MTLKTKEYGEKAEDIAAKYLEKSGYEIIEKNFTTKLGEIDIIAKDNDTLVFVEVKARTSLKFGLPEHSITYTKQRKISKVALLYLKARKQITKNKKARFDVVSILTGKEFKIRLIKNAFPLSYR